MSANAQPTATSWLITLTYASGRQEGPVLVHSFFALKAVIRSAVLCAEDPEAPQLVGIDTRRID